ncbi:hypothetical protein HaLaN_18042, partial [Haematococcus lacustris]
MGCSCMKITNPMLGTPEFVSLADSSRSPKGKQRQERRNGWETKRRQLDSRVLHGLCKQLGLTKKECHQCGPALSQHWARWFNTRKLANKGVGQTVSA